MHIPPGAIDLAKVKERADERDKAEKEAADQAKIAAAQARARSWDRKMQRAFKGILPRPLRRRMLAAALVRFDKEHPDDAVA